jgi:hypothetical protein
MGNYHPHGDAALYETLTDITATIACVGNISPGFNQVGPLAHFRRRGARAGGRPPGASDSRVRRTGHGRESVPELATEPQTKPLVRDGVARQRDDSTGSRKAPSASR